MCLRVCWLFDAGCGVGCWQHSTFRMILKMHALEYVCYTDTYMCIKFDRKTNHWRPIPTVLTVSYTYTMSFYLSCMAGAILSIFLLLWAIHNHRKLYIHILNHCLPFRIKTSRDDNVVSVCAVHVRMWVEAWWVFSVTHENGNGLRMAFTHTHTYTQTRICYQTLKFYSIASFS